MKKSIYKSIVLIVIIVLLSQNVLAYLNPGLGSLIIGSLWPLIVGGFVVAGAFVVKRFWNPIKNGVSKIFKKAN